MSQIQETFLFTPTSISGCQLWLDAADRNTLVLSGTNVTQWRDKSGNLYNCSVSTGANPPIFNTNFVQFRSASSQSFDLPQAFGNAFTNQTYSVFIVGARRATGFQYFISGVSTQLNNTNLMLGYMSSTAYDFNYYGNSFSPSVEAYSAPDPTRILSFELVPSQRQLVANGTIVGTGSATFLAGFTSPFIGKRYAGVDLRYHDIDLFEMITFIPAVSTTQRQQVEGYLAWKWGLQGSLPSNHPFKTYRPLAQTPFPTSISPMPLVNTNVPVFLPTQISGCAVWLDGADTTTFSFSSGTNISQWRDKSGNGTTVSQGTSINQPIYASNTTNGIGTVQFNAIARNNIVCFDTSPFNYGTTNRTSFFILRNNWISGATASSPHWFWPKTGNGSAAQSLVGWIQSVNRNTFATLAITAPTGSFFILTNRFGSSTNFEQMYLNGNSANAVTLSRTGAYISATSGYRIGGLDNADVVTTNYWFDGNIGEIVLYNTTLTVAQCQQVEGYLAWKWGLTSSLPVGHPYKTPPIAPFPVQVTAFRGSLNQWIPTQISGCQIWLDAMDNSTITRSGSSVTSLKEKAQNIVFTTQGNSSFLTVEPNSIQTQQALYFNNTSAENVSLLGSYTQPANFSIFVVWKNLTQRNNGYRNIVGWQFSGSTPFPGAFNFGYPGVQTGGSLGIWDTYTGAIGTLLSVSNLTNYIGYSQYASPSLSLNGNTPSATTLTVTAGATNLYIGGVVAITQTVSMYLGEVVIYNSILSTSQRQQVEGYLAWKWGLVGSLPANHPYKLWPPSP